MPLKGFLSSKGKLRGFGAGGELSDSDKLSMLDELEQSGLGWFWASDSDGKITYLSPSIAERIDVPMDAIIGQPLASVFAPADREGRTKSLSLMLGAHKSFTGYAVRAEGNPDKAVLRLSGQPSFSGDKFRASAARAPTSPTNITARKRPSGWPNLTRSPGFPTATG